MIRHMRPCSKGFVVPEPANPCCSLSLVDYLKPPSSPAYMQLDNPSAMIYLHADLQSPAHGSPPPLPSLASSVFFGLERKINLAGEGSTLHDSSIGPKIRNREHNCCVARLFPAAGLLKLASLLLFYADLVCSCPASTRGVNSPRFLTPLPSDPPTHTEGSQHLPSAGRVLAHAPTSSPFPSPLSSRV